MSAKFLEGVMCGVVAGLVLQWLQPRTAAAGTVQVLPAAPARRPKDLRVVVQPPA
jgi:hypothetical protein